MGGKGHLQLSSRSDSLPLSSGLLLIILLPLLSPELLLRCPTSLSALGGVISVSLLRDLLAIARVSVTSLILLLIVVVPILLKLLLGVAEVLEIRLTLAVLPLLEAASVKLLLVSVVLVPSSIAVIVVPSEVSSSLVEVASLKVAATGAVLERRSLIIPTIIETPLVSSTIVSAEVVPAGRADSGFHGCGFRFFHVFVH